MQQIDHLESEILRLQNENAQLREIIQNGNGNELSIAFIFYLIDRMKTCKVKKKSICY